MRLHELYPFAEERKTRRRVGRGSGSGLGKTAGRGNKGQNSRSGGGARPGFEGGQMPLQRRLPKHGFKNDRFRVVYEVINVGCLAEVFADKAEVTLDDMYKCGLAKCGCPVKILGDGEVTKAMKVEAHKFSASALEKIQQAGGEAKALEG